VDETIQTIVTTINDDSRLIAAIKGKRCQRK